MHALGDGGGEVHILWVPRMEMFEDQAGYKEVGVRRRGFGIATLYGLGEDPPTRVTFQGFLKMPAAFCSAEETCIYSEI